MRRLFLLLLAIGATITPASTATAQDAGPTLTLDDAIRLALQRNRSLKVTFFSKGISRANLLAARGQFDPAFVANRSASETRSAAFLGSLQLDDIRTDNYSLTVQGLMPWGLTYSIGENSLNERDLLGGYKDDYQTFGGFNVTQPLLKGFGFGANLASVRIAKADRGISDWDYRQAAIDTVTNVVVAYSNLRLAHDELDIALRTRALAESLLADNEKSYKVGSISKSDVITARSSVASLGEPILIAERAVRDNQNQLRNLIGEDSFFESEPLFTLAPVTAPDVTVSPREDLQQALNRRPDYQAARLGITKTRATEAAAANGLLPEVNFVGGYGYNGLATTLSSSRQMVSNHDSPSYSAGLVVTVPFTFAVGRGQARAARLGREQAEENLRQIEANIAVSVATAAGQIETTRKRVAADRAAYELAKQALDAEEKKKLEGASTTLSVVQQQQFLASVENNLAVALASEFQAVANYDHELGTTLDRYQVKLAGD